jgi:hypothetical protein
MYWGNITTPCSINTRLFRKNVRSFRPLRLWTPSLSYSWPSATCQKTDPTLKTTRRRSYKHNIFVTENSEKTVDINLSVAWNEPWHANERKEVLCVCRTYRLQTYPMPVHICTLLQNIHGSGISRDCLLHVIPKFWYHFHFPSFAYERKRFIVYHLPLKHNS